jgi:hypothetical protein
MAKGFKKTLNADATDLTDTSIPMKNRDSVQVFTDQENNTVIVTVLSAIQPSSSLF